MAETADDFRILLGTTIDTDDIRKKLSDIKDLSVNVSHVTFTGSAIDDIKKQLKNNDIHLNVDLGNVNDLNRKVDNLGKDIGRRFGNAFTSNEAHLDNFKKSLKNIGFNDTFIDKLASRINGLGVQIDSLNQKVSTSPLKKGNKRYNLSVEISGIDKMGNAVNLVEQWQAKSSSALSKVEADAWSNVKSMDGVATAMEKAGKSTDNFANKAKEAAAKANREIEKIKSEATKSAKPIQQKGNLDEITRQAQIAQSAVEALKQANASTFTDAKIKADDEVAALKRMVKEYQNAEYVATSLRTKDIGTIKQDELSKIDAFIAKMEQSGHVTEELRGEATALKAILGGVTDSKDLVVYLDLLSNLEAEFSKVEAEAKATEKALNINARIDLERKNFSALEPIKHELQESGRWTEDLEEKWNSLSSSLGQVKSTTGLSTWKTELKGFKDEMSSAVQQVEAWTESSKLLADGNRLINNNSYGVQFAQLEAGFKKTGDSAEVVQKKLAGVRSIYQSFVDAVNNGNAVEAGRQWTLLDEELVKLQNDLKIAKIEAQESVKYLDSSAKIQLGNQIERWLQQNTAATKDARTEMQGFLETVRNGDVTTEQAKQIRARMGQITNDMRAMGKLGASTFGTLRKDMGKFAQWIGASRVVMKVFQELEEGIQLVKDLDAAMTNINYTMNVSSKQLDNVANSSVKMAKDLNTTTSNVLGAVTLYANANETAESILEKAKSTVMLSNVTGMGTEDAANVLQGAMRQFDLAEEDLMHISDVLQSVSAAMPYDFTKGVKELAEGIEAAGTVAKESGYDLERYSSLLGVLIANTRQSGSELSRALRTMMQRTTKVSTSAIKTGDITEDDVSNAEKALRRVGIEIRPTVDTFKDFDEIMLELYEHIDKLSEADLNNLAYELAGIRQGNVFRTMIKSYGEYQDMVEKAYDSDGKALENQEKYAKSIKGRLTELQAVGESFWTHFLDSDTLKVGISSLTTLLKLLEGMSNILSLGNWNSFGTFATGLGAYLGARNIGRGEILPPYKGLKYADTHKLFFGIPNFLMGDNAIHYRKSEQYAGNLVQRMDNAIVLLLSYSGDRDRFVKTQRS